MAWIDYKKAYDFVPYSRISECIELFGTADNVRNVLEMSMKPWKLSLTSNGEDLREVDVKREIFQRDSFSPQLFVLNTVTLSLVRRKVNRIYEWGNKENKLNYLLFVYELKLFPRVKNKCTHL